MSMFLPRSQVILLLEEGTPDAPDLAHNIF
jgi:hypothetical protein